MIPVGKPRATSLITLARRAGRDDDALHARDKSRIFPHPKEPAMELTALQPASRPAQRPVQLVLIRANGPLFYSVASASLLEADMPLAADRLLHFFGTDRVLSQWLKDDWLPRKVARARQLREYVETVWPEYD
jgi:hypothetical protein